MKRFLGMGALALAVASMPTQQASAWIKIGFNCNYCFEWSGIQCPCFSFSCCPATCAPRCGDYMPPQAIVTFPGGDHVGAPVRQQFSAPMPGGAHDAPAAAQWSYPNYSNYRSVSYYPAQAQPNYYPAGSYYSPQYTYPANYGVPSYYQAPAMTFDR